MVRSYLISLLRLDTNETLTEAESARVPTLAETARAATVHLKMLDDSGKLISTGSGFFVQKNIIVTNYHVIKNTTEGTAKLVNRSTTYKIEGVTARNTARDLALLKVTTSDIAPLPLGDSDAARIGETVYVAGSPKDLEGTFSEGILSNWHDAHTKERFLMTAATSPGSSGGPVLNRHGEVIGVASGSHRDGQSLHYAVPAKYIHSLLSIPPVLKPLREIGGGSYRRRHGLRRDSVGAAASLRWGHDSLRRGNYALAVDDFTKAIYALPNNLPAYLGRAQAQEKLGRYREALRDYDRATRLDLDNANTYLDRGQVLELLKLDTEAIEDYDTAIRLKPRVPHAYALRGRAKAKVRHYAEAIADYSTAIQLTPTDASLYLERAAAYEKFGMDAEALADYDTVIRLRSDDAHAHEKRGHLKQKIHHYLAAIEDYDIAIRLSQNNASLYLARAEAKKRLGRPAGAKRDLYNARRLAVKAEKSELRDAIDLLLQILD